MSHIEPRLRELETGEIPRAAELVRRVFMEYNAPCYGEKGLETFLSFITEQNLREQLQKHGMRLFGAFDGYSLLGVLALSRGEYINLLFTDGSNHRQGIAGALVQRAAEECRKAGNPGLSVNADLSAVPAYRAMGWYPPKRSVTASGSCQWHTKYNNGKAALPGGLLKRQRHITEDFQLCMS